MSSPTKPASGPRLLPIRCLDLLPRIHSFLKSRGYEEEGLYRVNGAVPDVKHWYQRLDREGDVNLMAHNVPDINSIGGLLERRAMSRAYAPVRTNEPEVPRLTEEEIPVVHPLHARQHQPDGRLGRRHPGQSSD